MGTTSALSVTLLRPRQTSVQRNAQNLKRRSQQPLRCKMDAQTPEAGATVALRIFSHTDDEQGWDRVTFSGPVVVPPRSLSQNETAEADAADPALSPPRWRMYYYGRASNKWAKDVPVLRNFPSGFVGFATSADGIHWERFRGPLPGGAVFGPSEAEAPFDSVAVAVSDVIPPLISSHSPASSSEDAGWRMVYFAGGMDETELPGMPGVKIRGIPWRPGLATSADGVHFTHPDTPLLPLGTSGEWDSLSITAPRILPPNHPGQAANLRGKWYMTYHTLEYKIEGDRPPLSFSVGVALSTDGKEWTKVGKVLTRGEPGAWDDGGVGFRHVFVARDGTYVMLYEAVSVGGVYAVGLATSADGLQWEKATGVGPEPGGPVLARSEEEGAWDNMVVGTPYVVAGPDGNHWLYYLGAGRDKDERGNVRGFGIAKSDGANYSKWTRFTG